MRNMNDIKNTADSLEEKASEISDYIGSLYYDYPHFTDVADYSKDKLEKLNESLKELETLLNKIKIRLKRVL